MVIMALLAQSSSRIDILNAQNILVLLLVLLKIFYFFDLFKGMR